MAKRGSSKWFSLRQEERVAKAYKGTRSPSSGGAVTDGGDVRSRKDLIECKHTGSFDTPRRSISVKLDDFEKVWDEALMETRHPVLCLSVYAPNSILANGEGCVDLSVRLMTDDVQMVEDREEITEQYGRFEDIRGG